MTKIKDFVILSTSSIYPKENIVYNLYSLPAFDNEQKCEILRGKDIQSNKYIVPDKCILFNKLNVRFKRVWRIDSLEEHKLCSTEFLPLIIDETKVNYQYFFYLLISDSITNYLCGQNANTSGSHKRISPADLLEIPVKLPSMPEQKAIGKILSDIDRKIALNKAINHNLAAMAKQLYDYWFVQFDFPNQDGKPYKSSGGKMVWNQKLKREIPEGWKEISLFEGIDVQYGFPFSTDSFLEETTDVPIVRIRDIINGTISAYSTEKIDEKFKLKKGDIVVGMDGNFHMNYWHTDKAYLNQRCVRLRPKKDSSISSIQIYYDIQPFIKAKEKSLKGSTVGHLLDKDLKELYLLNSNTNLRNIFDHILLKILTGKIEYETLTKQRNELLPLLMNGQVTVG